EFRRVLFRSDLVLQAVVVLAMGGRQPGGEGGVQVAARHALPHDGRVHRLELHRVVELALQYFSHHVGGGHAFVPAVHVAEGQGGLVGGLGGGGQTQGQGGGAQELLEHVNSPFRDLTDRCAGARHSGRPRR